MERNDFYGQFHPPKQLFGPPLMIRPPQQSAGSALALAHTAATVAGLGHEPVMSLAHVSARQMG